MRNLVLFLLLCVGAAAQTSHIEGTAIDSVTRQPLAGVHITLHTDKVAYGAMSDRAGHFSITGMPPAVYDLLTQYTGYVHPAGEKITLKAAEPATGFVLQMTPRAVIAGRVVDELGDPVRLAQVAAIPTVSGHPGERGELYGLTDDRGEFRMVGMPGKFYIRADPHWRAEYVPGEGSPGEATLPLYGTTWFPASESKERAAVIEVAAGHDAAGVEIRLARRRSLTIGGTITAPDLSGEVFVQAYRTDDSTGRHYTLSRPDGTFSISGLSPGSYRVFAGQGGGPTRLGSRVEEVLLDGSDLMNVNLTVVRQEILSGKLEIPANTPHDDLTVRLFPRGGSVSPKGGRVGGDGAFQLSEMFPGRFRVDVDGLPEDAWLKSVKLDDSEVPDGVLNLPGGTGGAKLKIVVSLNGGVVEGRVTGDAPQALVVLAATADEIGERRFHPVAAGEKFRFTGLRPGKYRLIAIDAKQYSGNLAEVKEIFPRTPEFDVHEGERIVMEARIAAKP